MPISLHSTQFPDQNKSESQSVVIGLDFGTSSSKVVINNRSADKAFTIPFDLLGHPTNKFLIPTRPYFNKKGLLCLSSIDDDIPLRELKGILIGGIKTRFDFVKDKEIETTPELLTIAYLAHVIRLARFWFLTKQKDAFGHANIEWQLNLGIPSTGNEFHAKKNSFQNIAISAWWLSTQPGDITIDSTNKALALLGNTPLNLPDMHPDNINVIPEIVAEVIGYAQSPLRNRGLHLLVDIGAGTVDIASFILHSDGGSDQYSILTGDVHWLGAFELHKHRIGNIKDRVTHWLDRLGKNEDPVQPIPDSAGSYLPDLSKLDIKSDRAMDSIFFDDCVKPIHSTLAYLRKKRDPKAEQWESGIPTFLCGGGSQISFYGDVISNVSNWWKDNQTAGLKVIELPKPNNLEIGDLPEDEFHRLAVAYGLSFPEYDIGSIKPPNEIDDVPTPTPRSDDEDRYVSMDQM